MAMPPRFPITGPEIDRVVARFYARIRDHQTLGPIFNGHIGTDTNLWRTHEAKIASFWRSALLSEGSYNGNPMQAHMAAGDVEAGHFAPWLALFDEVLCDELPPQTAQAFSALAHRIGQGLRMGVTDFRAPQSAVPSLS